MTLIIAFQFAANLPKRNSVFAAFPMAWSVLSDAAFILFYFISMFSNLLSIKYINEMSAPEVVTERSRYCYYITLS